MQEAARHHVVRRLGLVEYEPTWRAMREFTNTRGEFTPNELWLLEHEPVYTYGVAGREVHLPRGAGAIPVLKTDRGGQVTYHGPGQWVVYVLWNLARDGLSVRKMVRKLENAVTGLLSEYGISAGGNENAPGVYVNGAKIASLGLRIRKGCSYHGLALNAGMDLAPFSCIDPCGMPGLPVTQLRDLGIHASKAETGEKLLEHVLHQMSIPT
ncbi:MAG: lipoyl(octanoyl) transferase LipB [Betaproteobacteria bacterium]|nr:lipoyl(octanoyl) transferase LipB [Betaproteobacteria bacterium]